MPFKIPAGALVALVIRGKQGVGKGVFVNEFRRLFGPHGYRSLNRAIWLGILMPTREISSSFSQTKPSGQVTSGQKVN